MNRLAALDRLRTKPDPWELIVIGGGATGLCIALDAASRGLSVCLCEQSDFGKGTSSRSTKLIHGGVRYLQQGNLSLVREALHERALLRANAPHLVVDQPFLIPCRGLLDQTYYRAGLKLYDFLAGQDRFPASRAVNSVDACALAPGIRPDRLGAGVVYHDGQFDDARLLISLARTAHHQGACLLNYVRVEELLKTAQGQCCGVRVRDTETDEVLSVRGRCVINASGPFGDNVRQLDEPGTSPMIVPSQGVHLVVDAVKFPGTAAVIVPKTSDGRVIFLIPWHGRVVIGTTDTPISKPVLEPTPQPHEIEFLIETANQYLAQSITLDDVKSCYTGIRPLVRDGKHHDESGVTKQLSREHVIRLSPSGLLTIAGGKWTTARKMAEDCIDEAIQQFGLSAGPCQTQSLHLHGSCESSGQLSHRSVYGSELPEIVALEEQDSALATPYTSELPIRPSEVVWAVRHEMARCLDDVLARRTRMLFLNAHATQEIAAAVGQTMAAELGHSQAWLDQQLQQFESIAHAYSQPVDKAG